MTKKEIITKMINERDGVLLTCDVVQAGISKTYLMEYVRRMNLERVSHGVYLSPDAWTDYLYLLQLRYPQTIFSHETALYLLGLAEREPLQFTVTAKTGYHAKSMNEQNIKVYRVKDEFLGLGVVKVKSPAGHVINAYNAERTICDLLRNRNNVEIHDLHSALKAYIRSSDKNIPQLMRYSKELRVEKLAKQYFEILL